MSNALVAPEPTARRPPRLHGDRFEMFQRVLRGGATWAGEAIPGGGLDDGTPVPGLNSSSPPSGDVPRRTSGPGTLVPEELPPLCRYRVPVELDLMTEGARRPRWPRPSQEPWGGGHWGPLRGHWGPSWLGSGTGRSRRAREVWRPSGGHVRGSWQPRLMCSINRRGGFIEKQLIRLKTANRRGGGWGGPTSRKGDYVSWPERPDLRSGRGRGLQQSTSQRPW